MIVVYDIEAVKNFFLYVDYNIHTGEVSQFEVSDFANELPDLLAHLDKVKAQIGFNNLSYDAQIIQYIRDNAEPLLKCSASDVYSFIADYSSSCIERPDGEWPDYSEKNLPIPQLDLFKMWHYDNPQRRCGLKWLQYSMDWPNIEDMPIGHLDKVTTEEMRAAMKYYCTNDVMSTYQFYEVSQGKTDHLEYKDKDKIAFRKDITKRLGIQCRNFSDVKIGDEINKQNYLKATGKKWWDVKKLRAKRPKFTFGDCFPDYVEFHTPELKEFFERIRNIYVDVNSSSQKFIFHFDGVEYTMAKGGLHSKDRARLVRPLSHQILRDADVGSMYPNAIRKRELYPQHLGVEWLQGYSAVIQERLEAKRLYKETGDKSYESVVEALKLALNGGSFGKTQQDTSWQYDPFITFAVTVGCQIDLAMLIERLTLSGIRVLSSNTDGIVCLFNKDQEEIYNKTCEEWEIKVGNHDMGKLEYSDYSLFAQTGVNSYIAIKTDNKPKYKGQFVIYPELHKNKSFRIIPKALDAYYRQGLNPVKFIREHDNIFDFCAGSKANQEWYFELRGIRDGEYKVEKLLKTNRFYISNEGWKLVKINKEDNNREIQKNSGDWMCTIYNKHEPKALEKYDLNYNFYIEETFKIISKIEPDVVSPLYRQMSLF